MRCTSCGTNNDDSQRFCTGCGTPLPQVVQAPPVNTGMPTNQPMPYQPPMNNVQQVTTPKKNKPGVAIGITFGILVGVLIFLYNFMGSRSSLENALIVGTFRCSESIEMIDRSILVRFEKTKEFRMMDSTSEVRGTFSIDSVEQTESEGEEMSIYVLTIYTEYRNLDGQINTEPYTTQYAIAINQDGVAAMMNRTTQGMLYCIKNA